MVKDLNDPTNVDTIPAMLTEGEFVLNKEATQMYGPLIEQMNNHGLQQRHAENQMLKANVGKKVSKLHGEGYTAPGQAYAIAKSMGYNTGGLVSFLKEKEGYRDEAYQDSAGVWTIGYGRTRNPDGSPVKPGQRTQKEAEDNWLTQRAASERTAIDEYAKKYGYDWSDNQKDALASFRYNGGQGMLDQLTDNGQRDNTTIEQKLPQYNKVTDPKTGKKVLVEGLQNRRNAELELWGGKGNQVPGAQEQKAPPPTEAPPAEAASQSSGFGFDPAQLAQLAIPQGGGMIPMQPVGLRGKNPEYIPSAGAVGTYNGGGPVQYLRNGGRANITEEERERRRLARLAAANNVSRGRNVARQAPLVAPTAPQQPASGSAGRNVGRAGVSKSDPFVQQYPDMFDVGPVPSREAPPQVDNQPPVPGSDEAILQGSSQTVEKQEAERQRQNALLGDYAKQFPKGDPRRAKAFNQQQHQKGGVHPGVQAELPPMAPAPVPAYSPGGAGRGGAPIEQLSEEQIGMAYDAGDPRAIAYGENEEQQQLVTQALDQNRLNQSVAASETEGAEILRQQEAALQQQLAGLQSTPAGVQVGESGSVPALAIPEAQAPVRADAWSEAVLPEDVQESIGGMNFQADAPSAPAGQDPRGEGTAQQKQSASPAEQRTGIKNAQAASEEQAPVVSETERADIVTKGQEMGKNMSEPERNKVASTIKETFGDLFDKKELARMGVLMLGAMATGMSPGQALAFAGTQYLNRLDAKQANYDQFAASGQFTKQSLAEYKKTNDPNVLVKNDVPPERTGNFVTKYDKNGKQVQLEEVKIGDSTYLADKDGNIKSGFDYVADPSEVRGSKEYRTRVKTATSNIESQLKEMRETFDVFDKEKGSATTDILPTTNANKVAQWAVDNGVSPDQLGGLVSSAYQDAINDKRQDGSRARDLVPYLQQLVVRQKVGGNASAFHAKSQPKDGPPRFVNPRKMQALNHKAYEWLASKGKTGGVEDLSNLVYTAALEDWNGLAKADRDTWNDGADDDINGFYDYVTHRLTLGDL